MELSEGPLKHLKGSWLFKSLSETASKIELHLQFEADGAIKKVAAKQLVERTSTSVVDALIKRAHAVLGVK
jgi:ribosome-associated toxin RatA of RatAB toxin-antitoxin module